MFKTIASKIDRDKDYPERQHQICVLERVLDGTIYDVLEHPFHEERTEMGEYIPLAKRRPSARYGLCKIVVDDSVSLLFDEGHFPTVQCEDQETAKRLLALAKEVKLNQVMIDAATRGSVGSVVVLMRALKQKVSGFRIFFTVMGTQFLTPTWAKHAPDTLEKVREQYKVKREDLEALGYTVDKEVPEYWFAREWDETAETWFLPWPVKNKDGTPGTQGAIDQERTVTHDLGFVPMVWIRNLPGGDDVDGVCTFPPEVIDDAIQIDYQLSQLGRGLKYSSDPTLMIKESSPINYSAGDGEKKVVKGPTDAILVGPNGDAKLLEINGSAAEAVINYVRALRELALETAHGNRANADKISAAQSGRAMELMNQSLIWLADKLRISYGEGGLLDLLRMVVKASQKFELVTKDGKAIGELSDTNELSLKWPRWYAPTAEDRMNDATTLQILTQAKVMSRETATGVVADTYDIEDEKAELSRINSEVTADAAAAADLAAKTAAVKPAA